MHRVFIDMDGPIVDFDGYMKKHNLTPDEAKYTPGAYLAMEPTKGALKAVRAIIAQGWEVWIATKPPTGGVHAYSEKAQWIIERLPELKRRIIITHDKGLLGDANDILIDDRPWKANCGYFEGDLYVYASPAVVGTAWEDEALSWGKIVKNLQFSAQIRGFRK